MSKICSFTLRAEHLLEGELHNTNSIKVALTGAGAFMVSEETVRTAFITQYGLRDTSITSVYKLDTNPGIVHLSLNHVLNAENYHLDSLVVSPTIKGVMNLVNRNVATLFLKIIPPMMRKEAIEEMLRHSCGLSRETPITLSRERDSMGEWKAHLECPKDQIHYIIVNVDEECKPGDLKSIEVMVSVPGRAVQCRYCD